MLSMLVSKRSAVWIGKMRPYLLLCLLLWLPLSSQAATSAVPQRLISLTPHLTEWVYLLDAGERLVAVSDYSDYPEAAKTLPSFNTFGALNVEAILALKPDLVLAWRGGNPEADLQRLQQFGIRVFYSEPVLLDDIASELVELGQLLGQAEQGQQQAAAFRQRQQHLAAQYQAKPAVPVFFALGTEPLMTVANQAWPAQVLSLCAAQNIFADAKTDYPQVALEQLLARQPAVIVQASREAKTEHNAFWQRFTQLPAVQQHAFITLDANQLYRATPRILDAAATLCQQLEIYREPLLQ